MELTKTNILKIKKGPINNLEVKVCDYVLKKWNVYEDKKLIFTEVLYHGCISGIVSELIYYKDTSAFYKKYNRDIVRLLNDTLKNTGCRSMLELFGDKWDIEDPLAQDTLNQNLLAWFGFEETLRNIGLMFECLEDFI